MSRLIKLLCVSLLALPVACASDEATGNGGPADVAEAPAAEPAETPSAAGAGQETVAAHEPGKKYYTVDCEQTDESGQKTCLTDKDTYVGWRTFHAVCHVCHGENAAGSSFAPSLVKSIDRERFFDVVQNGYTGQIGVMPGWGENPNVKNFIDELYAYQQARADGVLKPGRPKRMD